MAYFENLEALILDRHLDNKADELIILSGYIGLLPIERLTQRKIRSKVIWGTLAEDKQNFRKEYHDKYKSITEDTSNSTEVLYKDLYDHSKIYCWLKNNEPIEILAGSANFSYRGLKGAHRESLFDVKPADYSAVHKYLRAALNGSILSTNHPGPILASSVPPQPVIARASNMLDRIVSISPPIADIYLGGKGRTMQPSAGLNWGHGRGHNTKDVGYLSLRKDLIRTIPGLFPNNGINPNIGSGYSHKNKKENAEILFDDGFVLDASFEQVRKSVDDGQGYYKALTSFQSKNEFGAYIRKRLGLGQFDKITDQDLVNYGRDSMRLELIEEGMYYADFSKPITQIVGNRTI